MASPCLSTPINRVTRDNLTVLIRNNILNDSVEFQSDCDVMETDSPVRSKNLQPISKKLFHSPMEEHHGTQVTQTISTHEERTRKARKRKQVLVPDTNERFKRAYIECAEDGYSKNTCGGMRKKILISLFHNKECSLDIGV